jgi:hypothetical protein
VAKVLEMAPTFEVLKLAGGVPQQLERREAE